jgi:hypothetical protein
VPFVLLKDPEEARARAKSAIAQGVDLLKVYTEISAEEVRAVVSTQAKVIRYFEPTPLSIAKRDWVIVLKFW